MKIRRIKIKTKSLIKNLIIKNKIFIFIFIIISVFGISCNNKALKNKNENNVIKITNEKKLSFISKNKQKKEIIILKNYKGKKYKNTPKLKILENITLKTIEKTINKIEERTGLIYKKFPNIIIQFKDYKENQKKLYTSLTKISHGEKIYIIELSIEYFINNFINLNIFIPKIILKTIIFDKLNKKNKIPMWLLNGIIYFTIDENNIILKNFISKILDSSLNIPDFIKDNIYFSKYNNIIGYLYLKFLKEYYKDGDKKVKIFINQVLWQNRDWEDKFKEIFNTSFLEIENKAQQFSLTYLGSNYRGKILAYRRVLKLYLQNKYLKVIPQFKKLIFQYEDENYLLGNINFWLGMTYYKLKRYKEAQIYFNNVIEKFSNCQYFPIAFYKKGLCYYYQELLNKAIEHLYNFIKDFPFHKFYKSAYFYIGECFYKQNSFRRAIQWYDKIIYNYPSAKKYILSLERAFQISKKLGWFLKAKEYIKKILIVYKNSKNKDKFLKELEIIKILENSKSLPQNIINNLNKIVKNYKNKGKEEKILIIKELTNIGKIAIPWLNKILKISTLSLYPYFINSLEKIKSSKSIPLLLYIIKKSPSLTKKTLKVLINISPPIFVKEIILNLLNSIKNLNHKKIIKKELDYILWGANDKILEKFPEIIRKLNKGEKYQLEVIDEIIIWNKHNPIPILLRLILYGNNKVKQKAINNLLLILNYSKNKISINKNILKEICNKILLSNKNIKLKIKILKLCMKLNFIPSFILKKAYNLNNFIKIKEIIIKLLINSTNFNDINYIIELFDKNINIKLRIFIINEIKSILIKENLKRKKLWLKQIINNLLKENKKVEFYKSLINILENYTQKNLSNILNKNKEEKKKILQKIFPEIDIK